MTTNTKKQDRKKINYRHFLMAVAAVIVAVGLVMGTASANVQHENELKGAFGDDYKQENVAGVGDYAGWDTTTKQLTIFQGPYMVIAAVNSVNFEDAEALDITRKFSRQFLAKLPK